MPEEIINQKLEQILNRLEREKSNSNRWLLSMLYVSIYETFKKIYDLKADKNIELIITDSNVDKLHENYNLNKIISEKTINAFLQEEYHFYNQYPKEKISKNDIDIIIEEILNEIGTDYLKYYNNLKEQGIYIEDIKGRSSFCINGMGLDENYIVIEKEIENTPLFISTLLHEYGHAYENKYMSSMPIEQQMYRYNNSYTEVMSEFFGRVALDYLIRNHITLNDSNILLNEYYSDHLEYLIELGLVNEAAEKKKCQYDDRYYFITDTSIFEEYDKENEIAFPDYYLKQYLNGDYESCMKYGYGMVLAEYFFDIYRQDKKEGLKRLKNFLANQVIYDDNQMVDSINLRDNNFEFLRKGLKQSKTYMKEKYKW